MNTKKDTVEKIWKEKEIALNNLQSTFSFYGIKFLLTGGKVGSRLGSHTWALGWEVLSLLLANTSENRLHANGAS